MAREGARVTGLDIGKEIIQAALLHALESGLSLTYVQETVERYSRTRMNQYDVITCMEVLEHVPDPISVIYACARLVKPRGHLFLSTINRSAKSWVLAIVGAEHVLKILPKGTHDYKKFIRPSELIGWIDNTPLHEKHMTGVSYNLLTDQFNFSRNIDVNYMVHMQHKG